jgi:glycosyltransferase involved in cell wall biosynthesis
LDILLRAVHFIIYKKHKTNIKLMLIGPDWKGGRKTLEKLVDDLGLHDHVVFYGAKYGLEKYQLYSMSSAFILTSRTEGMPTAVLEAMAFGLPCIVTPETNVDPRIMENGGCIFVGLSIEEIANSIEKAMSDKRRLELIGIKGKEWVYENYEYSKVAGQHIEQYRELLRSRV